MCARLREGLRARGVLCGKAQRGDADRHVRARRKAYASNINTKKVDRNAHNMGQVRRRQLSAVTLTATMKCPIDGECDWGGGATSCAAMDVRKVVCSAPRHLPHRQPPCGLIHVANLRTVMRMVSLPRYRVANRESSRGNENENAVRRPLWSRQQSQRGGGPLRLGLRRLRRTQRSLVLYPHLVRLRTVFTVMQCGGEHKELAGFVRLTTSALLSAVSSEHGAILALRAHVRCDVHQVELNECAAMRSKQAEPSKCAADVQQVEPSECAADVQQASRTSDVQQVEPNEGAVMQKKAESITCPNECVDVHQVESNECAVMRSKQGESNECAASRASALRRAERVRR